MAQGILPTETDIEFARHGTILQYESNSIEEFLENEIMVKACLVAENRFLQNIIHKASFGDMINLPESEKEYIRSVAKMNQGSFWLENGR